MRSGFEDKIKRYLDKNKIPYEYETMKIKYIVEKEYIPDFILPNGIIVEAKGYFSSDDRRKMLNVIKNNPELDIRMLFQNKNNKISKKSKTTYAMWCEKHNIKYSEGFNIPKEWLKE